MRDDGKKCRVRACLAGAGIISVLIGFGWTLAFFHLDRPLLAAMHVGLIVFGITEITLAFLGRLKAGTLLAGHFFPLFILGSCLFDRVPNGMHHATHMHFLPVALGCYFVFRRNGLYLKYFIPALCLVGFTVFAHTAIGFGDPTIVIPAGAAQAGVWTNTVTAIAELAFIVLIMNADISTRRLIDTEMRKAVSNSDFQLHYQPQLNEAGVVVGAEALIRWQHAKMGNVPPAKFIPLAEETGLIIPIGNWVLRTACAQLARWSVHPATQHLTLAVNVSASQFRQADFVQNVMEIVHLSGIAPSKLKLELTETMFVDDVDAAVTKMNALLATGIVWSLDDFGTGYSSLSVLNRLPLGQIKIDRSFTRDMLNKESSMAVTETIIELARKLHLQVIAEGVETAEQLNHLRALGCQTYQGYLFSPPVDIHKFDKLLASHTSGLTHT